MEIRWEADAALAFQRMKELGIRRVGREVLRHGMTAGDYESVEHVLRRISVSRCCSSVHRFFGFASEAARSIDFKIRTLLPRVVVHCRKAGSGPRDHLLQQRLQYSRKPTPEQYTKLKFALSKLAI